MTITLKNLANFGPELVHYRRKTNRDDQSQGPKIESVRKKMENRNILSPQANASSNPKPDDC